VTVATYSLTTSPITIDDGTSYSVLVTNTGAATVELSRGGRLRPNQAQTVYPEGAALTAAAVTGTSSVSTSTTTKPLPNAADPAALAANAAFTGTYARLLGERVRRAAAKAHYANSLYLGVMASPPTLTTATSNLDASLTKSYRTSIEGQAYFRITGGTPTQGTAAYAPYVRAPVVTMPSGSGGNTSGDVTVNTYQWSVEFVTDAPKVMLRYFNTATTYMIEVNDQPVSASVLAYPSTSGTGYTLMDFTVGSATIVASTGVFTTPAAHGLQVGDQVVLGAITTTTGVTAGTTYYVRTVPSTTTFTLTATPGGSAVSLTGDGSTAGVSKAAIRKIRVEYQQASAFDGVYIGPTYTISAPIDENNVKVAVVGDSVETGTGSTFANGGWSKVAGKMLGWTDVRQVAFGGTGIIATGTYNTIGSAQRIADAVAANPDLLIIPASQNDDSNAATLQAATLTVLQAYRAALPNTPIIVMGPDASSSGPSATRLSVEAVTLAAFNAWGDTRSWFVPVSNASDGAWFTGTGYTGAKSGSGNRDRFGTDTAHPNDLGHIWRASRFAAAFKSQVMPYL
jgi:lysophospholipase L1-like esterase